MPIPHWPTEKEHQLNGDIYVLQQQIGIGESLLKVPTRIEGYGEKDGPYKGVFTSDDVKGVIEKLEGEIATLVTKAKEEGEAEAKEEGEAEAKKGGRSRKTRSRRRHRRRHTRATRALTARRR